MERMPLLIGGNSDPRIHPRLARGWSIPLLRNSELGVILPSITHQVSSTQAESNYNKYDYENNTLNYITTVLSTEPSHDITSLHIMLNEDVVYAHMNGTYVTALPH